jgi:hypothetical protein
VGDMVKISFRPLLDEGQTVIMLCRHKASRKG